MRTMLRYCPHSWLFHTGTSWSKNTHKNKNKSHHMHKPNPSGSVQSSRCCCGGLGWCWALCTHHVWTHTKVVQDDAEQVKDVVRDRHWKALFFYPAPGDGSKKLLDWPDGETEDEWRPVNHILGTWKWERTDMAPVLFGWYGTEMQITLLGSVKYIHQSPKVHRYTVCCIPCYQLLPC